MKNRIRPDRALIHPLWVVSLVLLMVNDHVWKGSGWLPSIVTGKLSDFAGLLVAPVVLSVLFRVRSTRGWWAAHLSVAVGFSLINVWPLAAQAMEGMWSGTWFPWYITCDPSDLIALPMIGLSWRVFARAGEVEPRLTIRNLALGFGLLACMATSPPPEEPPLGQLFSELVISNTTSEPQVLRVRSLRATVTVDCEAASQDPASFFSRALFNQATVWLAEPGRTIPLRDDSNPFETGARDCRVYLVDGVNIAPMLLFWMAADYPATSLSMSAGAVDSDRAIVLQSQGAVNVPLPHPALFPAPPALDAPPPSACKAPGAELGVDWSLPLPIGNRLLTAVEASPDGCYALDLAGELETSRWYLCIPGVAFPFAVGEELGVISLAFGAQAGLIEGVELIGDSARLRVGRGADLVPVSPELGTFVVRSTECTTYHDVCGSAVQLAEVVFEEGLDSWTIGAGERVAVSEGGPELTLLRAQKMSVVDMDCLPLGGEGTYLESVWLVPANEPVEEQE
jgi:hypothetical protein